MLEILGQEFDFDPTCPDDMELYEAAYAHFQESSADVEKKKSEMSASQYMRGVCQCAIQFFDETLGDGASVKILGPKTSMIKCVDAANLLSEKLLQQIQEAGEKFKQFSPERLNQYKENG